LSGRFKSMAHDVNICSAKSVVVVEDEFLVRDLAVSELEENGYRVVEFETADAALPYLRLHGGETLAVVTDVQMPGTLNGLQLADIVSRIWPTIPVLITSGGPLVDPGRLPQCAKFLPKPWHPDEIVDRIRRLAPVPMSA
jgi:DNA-binding NtrC family response regulator